MWRRYMFANTMNVRVPKFWATKLLCFVCQWQLVDSGRGAFKHQEPTTWGVQGWWHEINTHIYTSFNYDSYIAVADADCSNLRSEMGWRGGSNETLIEIEASSPLKSVIVNRTNLYTMQCCISLPTLQKVGFWILRHTIHIHHSSMFDSNRFSRKCKMRNLMNPRPWVKRSQDMKCFYPVFLMEDLFGKAVWCSKLLKGYQLPVQLALKEGLSWDVAGIFVMYAIANCMTPNLAWVKNVPGMVM